MNPSQNPTQTPTPTPTPTPTSKRNPENQKLGENEARAVRVESEPPVRRENIQETVILVRHLESESESDYSSDLEERRRRRKENNMRKRREEEKKRKENKRCDRKKEKGKKGAVTNSWGNYGIINETDIWNKRPEFIAWLAEVKQVNLESLPDWEEKKLFKEYYDLDVYYLAKMKKEKKRGYSKVEATERTVFNDEEQRRRELLIEWERQKEEQVVALKGSMRSGMAQAMKEQAQLREEMAFQYKLGDFEAAAAIQRRLDPDIVM